jgi:hypothetical protein
MNTGQLLCNRVKTEHLKQNHYSLLYYHHLPHEINPRGDVEYHKTARAYVISRFMKRIRKGLKQGKYEVVTGEWGTFNHRLDLVTVGR